MVRTVVVGLLSAVLLTIGQPAAMAGDEEFGRTWAKDRQLRPGCHDYRYQYKVKPPSEEWYLETFLLDPRKREVGAGEMAFNADTKRGSSTFRLCRNVTQPGRFKIKGKLTYDSGTGDQTSVWIKPGFFRLRKAS